MDSVDLENKIDSLEMLYDAWQVLENSREFGNSNADKYIEAAQAAIDKAIVATAREVVEIHNEIKGDKNETGRTPENLGRP